MTRRIRLGLWAAATAGLALYVASHLSFVTDVTNFLPDGRVSELAQLSRELAHGELARTLVLTVGAEDPARGRRAAQELAEALRVHPEVAWLRSTLEPDLAERTYQLYFPRRHYFLSDAPEQELPARLSDAALRQQAERVRESLALPVSPLLKRIVPEDPLGAFPTILERLRGGEPPLVVRDGVFTTRDGRWAVLMLGTRHSAFDTVAQGPLLAEIAARFADARRRLGSDLVLEMSGASRFALQAEREMRGDAARIGAVSLLGVAGLFLLFFRSPHPLALAAAPALLGVAAGMAACIAAFGRLDGTTVGFGVSLIGSTIDYPVHVLSHWRVAPPGTPARTVVAGHAGSLWLAALTTVAGFIGLAFTDFQGFRELGVFATTGIATSLLVTLGLLPDLLPPAPGAAPLSARLASVLERSLAFANARRRWVGSLVIGALLLSGLMLPGLRFVDDLARFGAPDPALVAEEGRVRERVSSFDSGRLVVALADTPEQALAKNEAVHARLTAEIAAGRLAGTRSLHDLIWPEALQRRNLEVLRGSERLPERLDAAFQAAGFRAGAFAPFARALATPPEPLTLDALRASPLGPLAATLVMDLAGRTGIVTYLRGVHDPEAVRSALADLPDVHWFEQRAFLNQILAGFRDQTLRQAGLGSLLVLALLGLRYREPRRTFAAFLPCLLSTALVLSLLVAAGHEIHLLHVVSLLVVMGIGVDYGIYLVDATTGRDALGHSMISILLCCLTTLLSFGALALSSHPALRAIGLASGLGVAFSFLFAPATLLLLQVGRAR